MTTSSQVPSLTRAAVYERSVSASLERVWENVHDWEHLPSLHRESFCEIECLDSGDWGWRAQVAMPPGGAGQTITIELLTEPEKLRYVTRTLEGMGAGTEIWTTLSPVSEQRTDVRVEFLLPGVDAQTAQALGRGFTQLYTRLWDQDDEMMQQRTAMLALLARPAEKRVPPLEIGPLEQVRARLPIRLEFGGRPFRLVELDGELIVHSTICPHMFGPLDRSPVEDGEVECPWHGYRFSVRDGQGCGKVRMRLATPPRVEIDPATSIVRVV
jgi:nitrite reductase/ring-hydroxylating ferredoxin subunit/uncharacterized protein YndB with AHSA1/START domain